MNKTNITHRTWAEVNLDAIAYNIKEIKKTLKDKTRLMAVVKADAYGHGYLEVSKTMIESGADALGVAFIDEAEQLRRHGMTAPILILGYTPCADLYRAADAKVAVTISSFKQAKILSDYCVHKQKSATVHIKIDTGMNRIGIVWDEGDAAEVIQKICALKGIVAEGLFSHFACADEGDESYSVLQCERFLSLAERVRQKGISIPIRHICNSAGTLKFPHMHMEMVRVGIITYGSYPSVEFDTSQICLMPAMSLKTGIIRVQEVARGSRISYGGIFEAAKNMKIATIPIGYADGFSRILSGKVKVLAGGRLVSVVGRICMDQCMIDVSDVNNIEVEDIVTIIGEAGEGCRITTEDIADAMGTISYEVMCLIGKRVPRVYYRNGEIVDVLNYLA